MASVIGTSGSLRTGSFNTSLLRAAAALAPSNLHVAIDTIEGIPLYHADVEARDGHPPAVAALRERIAAADGMLIVTPEYNHSVPGVLKNAIDWCSRPAAEIPRIFGGKPVALMGATPGRGGTRLAQEAWLPVLKALGMQPWFGDELYVAGAAKVFDAQGNLVDDTVRRLLTDFMQGFAAFVEAEIAAKRGTGADAQP